ncbi:MAG: UvrD-helicase domain-containing protein [Muribaculaceae bacterium]|nr:UvrD-helicase domain-containing protein [Muribaculaceae bacterium]
MKNIKYKSAGAGSGKTYYLTHVLSDLIKEGKVRPDQVILTTFTKKAANDFKEKSKKVLYENGLYEAASQLDNALIGTIHSVAMNLIGKYWFFLGLSPALDTIAEKDTSLYQSQSLSTLATTGEIKFLKDFVRKMDIRETYGFGAKGEKYDYNFWKKPLKTIIAMATNHSVVSFDKSRRESKEFFKTFVSKNAPDKLPTGNELKAFIEELKNLPAALNSQERKNMIKTLEDGMRHPNFPYYLVFEKFATKLPKATQENFSEIVNKAKKFGNVWQSVQVYEMMEKFIDLMFDLAERWRTEYDKYKRDHNLLDFNDQEKYFLELLENEEVSKEISKEFKYVFVDEFQDCSPIQVKIFRKLSELVEESFWVGDNKQAIYGFRASDTELTETVVEILDNSKENNNKVETLDTSYRSVESIVKCCNKMFKDAFNELPEERVVLNPKRKDLQDKKSLLIWEDSSPDSVTVGIKDLIEKGEKPSDIAVLARKSYALNDLAKKLDDNGVVVNRENLSVAESEVWPLVSAILNLVDNDTNHLAKATIGFLTEPGYDTENIIGKVLASIDEEGKRHLEFLDSIPLVDRVLKVSKKHRHQSVAKLVESVLIESNVYEEAKKIVTGDEAERVIDTIISAAESYEESALRLGFVPTISGLGSYISEEEIIVPGNPDGVNLLTIHSSKGLEWKNVILLDTFEDPSNLKDFIKKDVFGVHFHKATKPTLKDLFPEVYITLLPYVYGEGNTNIPRFVTNALMNEENKEEMESMVKEKILEETRILYVAFTRASDALILVEMSKKNYPFKWLEVSNIKNADSSDNLKQNYNFQIESLAVSEDSPVKKPDPKKEHTFLSSELKTFATRDFTPSSVEGLKPIKKHYDFKQRISFNVLPAGMDEADLGNCIHHVFQMFEHLTPSEELIEKVTHAHGFSDSLSNPQQISRAWQNLMETMEKLHGRILNHKHEVPFRHQLNGQVFNGSIDMTLETEMGTVLIDFKSCPMGGRVLEKENPHYAGYYGGQLGCYASALTTAGKKPISSYIYYPISGILVELDMD